MTSITGIATDFVNFTRASNATVTDSDGVIKWAPHNLLTNSESFDASAWVKNTSNSVANSFQSPNGTSTADTIRINAGTAITTLASGLFTNSTVYASQASVPTVIGASYTYSLYVRAATGLSHIQLRAGTGSSLNPAITTATVKLSDGSAAGDPNTVVDIGGGWWLISLFFTATATTSAVGIWFWNDASIASATGTEGYYLWGAHVYRSDLGGMQANTSAYPMYNPTTPKNLLGYTEDFSNAYWVKFNASISANQTVAPNGLTTADLFLENTTNNRHIVYVNSASMGDGKHTLSVYVRKYTRQYVYIGFPASSSATAEALFDIDNPSTTPYTFATGAGFSVTDASIANVGNGWFLLSATFTTSGLKYPSVGTANTLWTSGSSFTNTFSGTTSDGIYLWGAQLSDSASLDTYSPVYGAAVTSAAYYGPRRDFDPVTLACKGLLVEEQRSNLVLQSAAFDVTATWTDLISGTGTNAVRTANAGVSPDGTSTADRLQLTLNGGTTTNDAVRIRQSATPSAGAATFSVWLKSYDGVSTYTMALGAVGSQAITVTGQWQRFVFSFTATGSATGFDIFIRGAQTPTHSNSADVLAWGAQLEAGSFATSYIPVGATTAGATRLADVASVSTQAFPYSSTDGTWVANFQTLYSGTTSSTGLFLTLDADLNKRILYTITGNDTISSKDASTIITATGDITGSPSKSASAYDPFGRYVVSNGGTVASGAITAGYASGSVVNINNSGAPVSLWLRQITYLPRRISNTELQTRTA